MYELIEKIPLPTNLQIVVALIAIVALTFLSAWLIRAMLSLIVGRLASRTKTDLDDKLFGGVKRHVHYLVYIIGAVALFNYLEHVSDDSLSGLFQAIDGVLYVLGVFVVAVMIIRLISTLLNWYATNIASKTETTLDDEFIPLADRGVKIVGYILALLVVLEHFSVDIMGLVAVLGVGSLAIALAAQETIANMIGGFVIMIDRPFRVGDRVRLDTGTTAVVNQIGIRSTKFRTFDNTLIIVPNAELMKSTVHNLSYPHPKLRVQIDVGVGYDSDMEKVRKVMLEEAHRHPVVIKDPPPSFYFLEFGDSSLNVSMRCWVADVSEQFRTASELREQVLNRFRQEEIEIPFPQRVVTMVPEETEPKERPARPIETHLKRQDRSGAGD
ncbi:MAG: mechanosensitive ion channel family protein, partial [candidate division Zixibacteria bacterium]|nr:mechanosensitive ion channel family protein [candidate division Zixibacteria bacterium]